MSFSYSGNPSSSALDEVRFHLQDTQPPGLLQDEEIQYCLFRAGGFVLLAVAFAMQIIATRYAHQAISQSTGQISTNLQNLAKEWQERLRKWLEQHGLDLSFPSPPEAIGITIADKIQEETDPTVRGKRFKSGQFDNPRAGQKA